MNKWEQDISETLAVEDWCKVAQHTSKTYIETSLTEANYNVSWGGYLVSSVVSYVFWVAPCSTLKVEKLAIVFCW